MSSIHNYEVDVKWVSGRIGIMSSPELDINMEVATPPQFPKGVEGLWSPEHLLVAAVNSCFMTTFLAIAENSKLDFNSFNCKSVGKLETVDGKMMVTEITLLPVVGINEEHTRERMERVLHKAEAACLISNSVKSKIICKPQIFIPALA